MMAFPIWVLPVALLQMMEPPIPISCYLNQALVGASKRKL